ncbi:MAG TPA: calcium-binding protein [Actinomycetota bacterium]|nr:calcium-binding protein [Actinomycetota bacterium]
MTRRLTHGKFRIVVAAVVATALATIGAVASAAPPNRAFTLDFRDSSGTVIIPCFVKSTTGNVASVRATKSGQGGPPMRSVDITVHSALTSVSVGSPTSSQGSWSSSSSGNTVSLDGSSPGLIKSGSWVQAPVTFNAPATVGDYQWTAVGGGPGGVQYTLTGTVPFVRIVNSLSECPAPPSGPTIAGAGPCVRPTIGGTAGDDLIVGTPGNDVILDLLGNNTVLGSGGNDIICTGPGNDNVRTLGGSDIAWDQGGRNQIGVGAGNDNVTSQNGPDRIRTGPGNDTVSAGGGRNQITTVGGKDRVLTRNGADLVKTGKSKDTVNAGGGKNRLAGGGGNDRLKAGKGKDKLNGGKGRDVCQGGKGKTNVFRNCEKARGRGA